MLKNIVKTRNIILLILLSVAFANAHDGHEDGPNDQTWNAGKDGDVNIREDVRIGSVVVKK